jgi:hypothetical protein
MSSADPRPARRLTSRAPRLALAAALLLAAAAAVGCADFSAPDDPAFGLPDVEVATPSFSRDVEPILDLRCATGGCHTPRTRRAGMVLAAGQSYASIVGVPATTNPAYLRVAPGDASASWLYRRIHPDPALRPGYARMPLATTPLTDNQIATIRNWIDQGAPHD